MVISSCFWKLILFIVKRFYLLYSPICGLLCLLSYWESINNHSWAYKVWTEKDKKFKSLSCQVTNNMETTLYVNDYKFYKTGKWRNNKNWLGNWFI